MRHPLLPNQDVEKILLSSPSRFVGEYDGEDLLIAHAWPSSVRQVNTQLYGEGTVFARSYLAAAFKTQPGPAPTDGNPRLVPSFKWVGDVLCAVLAVIFGKRFDQHGFLEHHGMFSLPQLENPAAIFFRNMPFNSSEPRADLQIPLNLVELDRVKPLLRGDLLEHPAFELFLTAARFYLRAIRTFQDDSELPFLDLVACGEVLAGFFTYNDEELFDRDTLNLLVEIRAGLPEGDRKARSLRGRLRQIRRRFVLSLLRLLDEPFFARTEAKEDWCRLSSEGVAARLGAAYDVRSKYLHAGKAFGAHMLLMKCLNEIQGGRPVVDDQDWGKALELTPSFVGLERIIRYCLLRFAHLHLAPIDRRLDGPGLIPTPEAP